MLLNNHAFLFQSLAHEIGHNLGINHDFVDPAKGDPEGSTTKVSRFDSHQKRCLGQGGLMDYSKEYENDKSCWSSCSVEDFTVQMNQNKSCLIPIDPKKPPKNPTKPDLTKNECDLSKVYPNLSGVHTLYLNGKNESGINKVSFISKQLSHLGTLDLTEVKLTLTK